MPRTTQHWGKAAGAGGIHMVPGPQCQGLNTAHGILVVHGAWCMVHGAWVALRMVLCTTARQQNREENRVTRALNTKSSRITLEHHEDSAARACSLSTVQCMHGMYWYICVPVVQYTVGKIQYVDRWCRTPGKPSRARPRALGVVPAQSKGIRSGMRPQATGR